VAKSPSPDEAGGAPELTTRRLTVWGVDPTLCVGKNQIEGNHRGEDAMPKLPVVCLSLLLVALWADSARPAMTDKDKAELATAVSGAKVTLEQGLMVSKNNGKPISGKFEIENGKPQLSVYIVKDGSKYSEVIVDHTSGEIAKAEPITDGNDLADAKKQNDGLFRATREIREAVKEAKHDNPGYVAVSVWPEMKDGHSLANVLLVKDNDWKTAVIDLTVYRTLIKD
jgi:hypothetical protein